MAHLFFRQASISRQRKQQCFALYVAIKGDVYKHSEEVIFYNLISFVTSRTLSISLTIKLTNLVE